MEDLITDILSIPEETRTIEFKRLGQENITRIIESVVAMANTEGGIILVGIDDPQKTKLTGLDRIYGIEENSAKFDELGKNLARITPPLPAAWPPKLLPCSKGKTIGLIHIPKAQQDFHSIDNHVFIRLEKGNKRLTPHEILKYAYAKGFQQADRELVDVDFGLLETPYFEKWRQARKIDKAPIEEILFRTGLARKNEKGSLKPSRAAALLFAYYPNDIMDTRCTIRIMQYGGTIETVGKTLNLLGSPKTIGGPIYQQIIDTHEYVLTLLRTGMRIPTSGFLTTYSIPERAITEAVTNAVIHRDYHQKKDIEVRIFEDRVEIESAGLFPYNITAFNIGYVRAEGYRNDLIVKHLREFPDPPNLDMNEGIRAMRSSMEAQKLYPPVFVTYPFLQDSVRVVLFNTTAPTEWEKVSHYLSKREKYVTNETVRDITSNPDTSKVSRLLKRWVDQGLLVKIDTGAKRTVKYRLPADQSQMDLFAYSRANKK
jgi:ATP-dependent DNA helicase RecG